MKTSDFDIINGSNYFVVFQRQKFDITSYIKTLVLNHKTLFSGFGLPPYDNRKEVMLGQYIAIYNDTEEFNVPQMGIDELDLKGYMQFEYDNGTIEICAVLTKLECNLCKGKGGGGECDSCGQEINCEACDDVETSIDEYWYKNDIPKKIHIKTINLNQGELF